MTKSRMMLPVGLIALAAVAAYANSFSGPFIFDDLESISNNLTIRHLWPLGPVLAPFHGGQTVSGRPVLNLTLAINYALGGTKVWGYHAVNLLIHILAGWTLFGIVRRTLEKVGTGGPPVRSRSQGRTEVTDGRAARPYLAIMLAFASALIWTVHPLQTESVTYVVQRAESLMGLFYLLTLYCFIRWTDGGSSFVPRSGTSAFAEASADRTEDKEAGRGVWAWLSVGACLFGMATKEVMVSAPVIVFLYDRTFVSGTFRDAWRRHQRLYSWLAGTWVLLGWLVASTHGRGGTAGLGSGVSWWDYAQTQFPAIVRYLRLAVWPSPLIFDYGMLRAQSEWTVVLSGGAVALLVVATGWGLFRLVKRAVPKDGTEGDVLLRPARRDYGGQALGFAGAWFFAILAPTSLVPGNRQTLAEHRMYLALAPMVVVAVCGLYFLIERILQRVGTGGPPVRSLRTTLGSATDGRAARPYLVACLALAAGLGCLTARRNHDYRSDWAIWDDTVSKLPRNGFAQTNLGTALYAKGRKAEAAARFEKALEIDPHDAEAHYNLGIFLVSTERISEAMGQYEEAIVLKPDLAEARNNLAVLLTQDGRFAEAAGQLESALQAKPNYAEAHINLGLAFFKAGRLADAVTQYDAALRLQPDLFEAHNNLGVTLVEMGRLPEALGQYEQALKLKPEFAAAQENIGTTLVQMHRLPEAADHLAEAVRIDPGFAAARNALGGVLLQLGRAPEALAQYREALRIKPDYAEAHANLGIALANAGRLSEAIVHFERAAQLDPENADAQNNLAVALASAGRPLEAIGHYEQAVRLKPDSAGIHHNLGAALRQVGRTEEAEVQFEEAARLDGNH